MRDIFEQLEDIAKMELAPRMAGRRMTMVVCPDRQKVQKIENDLKREAARAAASEAPAEPVAEEAPVEAPSETTTETSPESTASE